jgi:hypothetical protein
MSSSFRIALLTLALSSVACEKGEECEKARLSAATSWQDVKKQAGKLKFSGTVGFENLSASEKAEHHKVWNEIETQAGLVFDSFAFQKITWGTAESGREKAQKAFDDYKDKAKYASFSSTLQSASKKYEAVEAACR